jgi:D-hexose-6-phosphate mutarotase
MQDDGYKTFIAVEPGYVKEFKELAAGEEWEASVSQTTF